MKKIFKIIIFLLFFTFSASGCTASIGLLDQTKENKIKICQDVDCTSSSIIDFKIFGDSPLVVDSEKGLSGKAWGNELGWVTFSSESGGVFFDSKTGKLKGTARSENGGIINFSVTGQKVSIDPITGEWNGYAWVSGNSGGWIKFDCKDKYSCLKTNWQKTRENKIIQPENKTSKISNTPSASIETQTFFSTIYTSAFNFTTYIYNTFSSNLKNFINYLFK